MCSSEARGGKKLLRGGEKVTDNGTFGRQRRWWRKLQTTVVAEMEAANDNSRRRRRRGQRKLHRCPSRAKEVVVLSFDGGRSYTQKQRQWKEAVDES